MAENNYWSSEDDQGVIRISEEVVASIAAIAVTETEGVSGLCSSLDIAELLGKRNLSKGIKITFVENNVTIETGIMVQYGMSVLQVAKAVQNNVKTAVESMSGLQVPEVNVRVCGISFEKQETEKNTAAAAE